MKVFVVLVLAFVVVQGVSDHSLWNQFKADHSKTYSTLNEEETRFTIFQSNLRAIEQHNAKYENGEETYYLKVTQFADMTPEEFKELLSLGEKNKPNLDVKVIEPDSFEEPPTSVDWRQKGAVLKVKNQGTDGSSWAFSATGCLEGQNAITHNLSIPLSEGNLVDCINNEGGNQMVEAFKYVRDNGINSEADYPSSSHNCSFDNGRSILLVDEIYTVLRSEEALQKVVAQRGPVSVGVDASSFAFYGGGVFNPKFCSAIHLNHGVLAVGYGNEDGRDFWIVKNSWGTGWGEDGYIRMIRNHLNRCGIASMAYFATVK